ncbi:hypothetical protein CD116_00390 [Staphylococcus schweitzeri]|uniref:Uncharacterized protein n=1 Tax=Staphylococcus schweitzeri TaxID=1654388 RepID=A0A2K4ANL1_9STAP|nr:Rho termination factor N-terminal domain-containing protein [Staphylococcus schweitzeri]MBE2129763.1 hypothetical protein [Staphylococcus schweitzeri]PNZ51671.1 hypothetical protein CD116_00390 [Staphylococcus schweitzeri]CDR51888.1 Phage protein [Staphylococcus schweitzeri]CDR55011.1 Phage protein [Staphylococcus schweitzeri]VEE65394.1 Uncharacterised protein [Staphylococcus schweitzeri]
MVKFKVVREFKDSEHNYHKYKVGELYPAKGYSNPRVELLTNQIKNKYDKVYIVPLEKLTKQELLELCESLQIKASSSMVKSEIIELLNGEDNDD